MNVNVKRLLTSWNFDLMRQFMAQVRDVDDFLWPWQDLSRSFLDWECSQSQADAIIDTSGVVLLALVEISAWWSLDIILSIIITWKTRSVQWQSFVIYFGNFLNLALNC